MHFLASVIIVIATFLLAHRRFKDFFIALLIAVGVTMCAGFGKEILDIFTGGHPDWADILWDIIGMGAGVLIIIQGFLIWKWGRGETYK